MNEPLCGERLGSGQVTPPTVAVATAQLDAKVIQLVIGSYEPDRLKQSLGSQSQEEEELN